MTLARPSAVTRPGTVTGSRSIAGPGTQACTGGFTPACAVPVAFTAALTVTGAYTFTITRHNPRATAPSSTLPYAAARERPTTDHTNGK
jgi:hypothetical protein